MVFNEPAACSESCECSQSTESSESSEFSQNESTESPGVCESINMNPLDESEFWRDQSDRLRALGLNAEAEQSLLKAIELVINYTGNENHADLIPCYRGLWSLYDSLQHNSTQLAFRRFCELLVMYPDQAGRM